MWQETRWQQSTFSFTRRVVSLAMKSPTLLWSTFEHAVRRKVFCFPPAVAQSPFFWNLSQFFRKIAIGSNLHGPPPPPFIHVCTHTNEYDLRGTMIPSLRFGPGLHQPFPSVYKGGTEAGMENSHRVPHLSIFNSLNIKSHPGGQAICVHMRHSKKERL